MENVRYSKQIKWILFLMFVVLAVFFGRFDLEISLAFADPTDPVAFFFEVFGECTTPILGLLCFGILFHSPPKFGKGKKTLFRCFCLLGGMGMAAYLFLTLPEYFGAAAWLPSALLASGSTMGIVFWLCSCIPAAWREYYRNVVVMCILSFLVGMTVIEVLKNSFGRVRFREMTPPYVEYTPWFVLNGFTGSKSFPSGHTAHAGFLFSLLGFCDYPEHRKKEPWLFLLIALWTLAMGISRVRIGAHFVSDVLFGGTIAIWITFFVRHKIRGRTR